MSTSDEQAAELQLEPPQDDEVSGADGSHYVTFCVEGELFAVPMAPVQEIIRVPGIVHLPLAPTALDGLANLRGKVLPILSLRRLFGLPDRAADEATRALVINLGMPLGFLVDHVASVVSARDEDIQSTDTLPDSARSEFLQGVIKDGNGRLILLLDFQVLIDRHFSAIQLRQEHGGSEVALSVSQQEMLCDESDDERQLVSFSVDGQEYAIDIQDVQEIVQMDGQLVRVPQSEAAQLGVVTLRSRLLPLISLRRLFGMPYDQDREQDRVVVIHLGGEQMVGLVTDSVSEVLRVPFNLIDEVPGMWNRRETREINAICRLEDGGRLVSILDVGQMFDEVELARTDAAEEGESDMASDDGLVADADGHDEDEQVVVFRLGKEEFGVPIMSVQEIVRVPEQLTFLPTAPDYMEGVINLRGTVLPVIDQRRRLGLGSIERSERQRIMVYLLRGLRTGFIVDSVAEVLKVPRHAFEPAPDMGEGSSRLICRVANLQKQGRLIMMIDPGMLLDDGEVGSLQMSLEQPA